MAMSEHEALVASELVKLPKGVLRAMWDAWPVCGVLTCETCARLPRGVAVETASTRDLAEALAPQLAKRDFLRSLWHGAPR